MRKSRLVIMLLLIFISVMTVGYAIFDTQLKINGKSEIIGQWNIKIVGIEATEISEGCNAGEPLFTNTTATFNAELQKPGDKITYVITIQNLGTIDAVLERATFVSDEKNGSPAIIYTTTNPSNTLNAGEQTTCMVTVIYDENYTEVPSIMTKTLTGIINYVQK